MFTKPSPDSLSVVMVLRRYVLNRLIVEKDLSAVAVDTGIQSKTIVHSMIFG